MRLDCCTAGPTTTPAQWWLATRCAAPATTATTGAAAGHFQSLHWLWLPSHLCPCAKLELKNHTTVARRRVALVGLPARGDRCVWLAGCTNAAKPAGSFPTALHKVPASLYCDPGLSVTVWYPPPRGQWYSNRLVTFVCHAGTPVAMTVTAARGPPGLGLMRAVPVAAAAAAARASRPMAAAAPAAVAAAAVVAAAAILAAAAAAVAAAAAAAVAVATKSPPVSASSRHGASSSRAKTANIQLTTFPRLRWVA